MGFARVVVLALCALGGDAFTTSISRPRFAAPVRATRKAAVMIDFGLLKGTPFDYKEEWSGLKDGSNPDDWNPCVSEVSLEKLLNKDGLRYRLNRTEKEAE